MTEDSKNTILFGGPYGDMYSRCLYAITSLPDHERSPMQVYLAIDDALKTVDFHDREEREKYRNVMISRVEPYIYYGHCEGCGTRLLATDDSFCSRTCETRYIDWR
jgi:predicted nucleic acid-binding Zn ribbon protein